MVNRDARVWEHHGADPNGVRRRPRPWGMLWWLLVAGLLCAVSIPLALQAAQWSGKLKGGGKVTVDPRTNRIMVEKNGVQTQLWDGVHRLQDGSSITVHSGQVVPNQEILRAREGRGVPEEGEGTAAEMWIGAPIVGYSPCEKLVRRVCGEAAECADSPGCPPARQLLQMEEQERAADPTPNRMTYASGQCQEADRDREFFATCGAPPGQLGQASKEQPYAPPPPCQLLVDKVCGGNNACAGETACDAARQLLDMAAEERGSGKPAAGGAPTPTDHQCTEALNDDGFFKPCTR
ncbi:MAG: hypothetical protein PVI91_07870 [Gammaproteobacteria bacterium]